MFVVSMTDALKGISLKNKKFLLAILILIFTLFRGLRWRTGTDWLQFQYCFDHTTFSNIFNYDRYGDGEETMEFGYMALNWLVSIFGNYTLFLLITNFFLLYTWATLSIKIVPRKPIMTFSLIMISNMLFPVRLQLTAGIICWSIYYLQKEKYLSFIITTLFACTFHKAAIMVVPLLIFLRFRVSNIISIIILALTSIATVFTETISEMMKGLSLLLATVYPSLASNIGMYSNLEIFGYEEKSVISQYISLAYSLIFLFAFILARHYLESKQKKFHVVDRMEFNIYFNCFLIFTFVLKFFDNPVLGNLMRVSEFFTFGYAICLMLAFRILENKVASSLLVVTYAVFYLYKMKSLIFNTSFPDVVYPYYCIFDSSQRSLY